MGRRIAWDEPCLTLTCSPGQKMTERCHPEEERPFTVREYAEFNHFQIHGSLKAVFHLNTNRLEMQYL